MTNSPISADVVGGADGQCAIHADRAADAGVCPRCGAFMCVECRTARTGLCSACQRRLDSGKLVAQVPLFAIALMIHGGLLVAVGGFVAAYGVFLGWELAKENPFIAKGEADAIFAALPDILVGALWTIGVACLFAGALQLLAGYRARAYRSRKLAVGSLVLGLVSVFACYCAPSSLVMLLWGLVVLLSKDVEARFAAERSAG